MTRDDLEIIVGKCLEPGQPVTTYGERLDTVMRAADAYAGTLIAAAALRAAAHAVQGGL